jgi:hypothetical protein
MRKNIIQVGKITLGLLGLLCIPGCVGGGGNVLPTVDPLMLLQNPLVQLMLLGLILWYILRKKSKM